MQLPLVRQTTQGVCHIDLGWSYLAIKDIVQVIIVSLQASSVLIHWRSSSSMLRLFTPSSVCGISLELSGSSGEYQWSSVSVMYADMAKDDSEVPFSPPFTIFIAVCSPNWSDDTEFHRPALCLQTNAPAIHCKIFLGIIRQKDRHLEAMPRDISGVVVVTSYEEAWQ